MNTVIIIPSTGERAKKYFCYNFFKNKLTIGLWGLPDVCYERFPKLSALNGSTYSKFGIRWKKLLFEIVWNKIHFSFDKP